MKKDALILYCDGLLRLGESGEAINRAEGNFEIPRNKLLYFGRKYLAKGWYFKAAYLYRLAGAKISRKKLMACAEKVLEIGGLYEAFSAYEEAGAKDKIIFLGEEYFKKGRAGCVVQAYELMKIEVPSHFRVAKGEYYLEIGWPNDALKCFEEAGVEIPRDKFVACGDKCMLQEGNEWRAINAYEIAEAKDKLIACGKIFLERREPESAIEAFKTAGVEVPRKKLITCGDRCLEDGLFYQARDAFARAKAEIPRKKLMVCGSKCMGKDDFLQAIEAYVAAKSYRKLIAIGERFQKNGEFEQASSLYERIIRLQELGYDEYQAHYMKIMYRDRDDC